MSLHEILSSHGFKFNKQFGQNFIADKNLLSAIVADSLVTKDDTVVEIGVGAGTLTKELALNAGKVIAFEIDRNLEPILKETLYDVDNVELIFADALNYPDREINNKAGKGFKVVANLPYYITTPIIMKFIEGDFEIDSLTVMVQYEVAKRFVAKPDTADYGAISVALDFVSDPVITRKVGRNMFYPQPNVDSAVVYIPINRNKYGCDYKKIRKLVKAAFAMRRKTLVNNLMVGYGINREQAEAALFEAGLDVKIRGEVLSSQDFMRLFNALEKQSVK